MRLIDMITLTQKGKKMSNKGDLKSAFEYTNERMSEFQVGDFIEYSEVVDSEFNWTKEYLARVVKIQFGKIGFWGRITIKPSFVIEFIEDGSVKDIIFVSDVDRFSSACVYPFAEYDNSWLHKGWGTSRSVKITKLDNVGVKGYLLSLRSRKEEMMRQEIEEKDRKRKEKEKRKTENDAISKAELNALLNDFRNT